MAVNNDKTNKLYSVNDTSVKFFSSLTRRQAKGLDSFIYDGKEVDITYFPGAICYVSDSSGNSIYLNTLLFGDGAKAGSISGGDGGGITEVNLSDIVIVEADGTTLIEDKTLADYFDLDGKIITDYLIINTTLKNALGQDETVTAVSIDKNGIVINGNQVATLADILSSKQEILTEAESIAQSKANQAETNAKIYSESLLTSAYKVKGSVDKYDDLTKLTSPKNGDVYNVRTSQGTLGTSNYVPPGTNYVYIENPSGNYWDALGGTIDLSGYASQSSVNTAKEAAISSSKDYTDGQIGPLKSSITDNLANINNLSGLYLALQTLVNTNSLEISKNTTNIETNTTNITNISTLLTWQ